MRAEVCNESDGPDFPLLSFLFVQRNWAEQDLPKEQQDVCHIATASAVVHCCSLHQVEKRKDAEFECRGASLNQSPIGLFHCTKTEQNNQNPLHIVGLILLVKY